MTSTYVWITTYLPLEFMAYAVNIVMVICLSFLPIKIEFDKNIGKILFFICLLTVWSMAYNGAAKGFFAFVSYLPVIWLIMLPANYKRDLLGSVTKWYAILLAIGLVEYFVLFFGSLPKIGTFIFTGYPPYDNYVFYIKNTFDFGFLIDRFNAFFLEPGHQALASTFLLLANGFKFKNHPYNIILLVSVVFSFSLAGYLLLLFGWGLLYIKNLRRAALVGSVLAAVVIAALTINQGDNAVNELIVSRLEYDETKGIKGNNRYFNNTDYVYERASKQEPIMTGVRKNINMDLVSGAGYKIYVIKYGWIGVLFVALFYMSLIPSNANKKYALTFFLVLTLCFVQRAYPAWYSWLMPYVLGIYLHTRKSVDDDPIQEDGTNGIPLADDCQATC